MGQVDHYGYAPGRLLYACMHDMDMQVIKTEGANKMTGELWLMLVTCFSAVFTNNILLTYFLGMCPFTSVSREVKTSAGLGMAVIFVMTSTCALNWIVYHWVLVWLELEFFRFILFIIIIIWHFPSG